MREGSLVLPGREATLWGGGGRGADIRSGWQEGCRGGGRGGPVDPGANHRQAGKPTPMKPPFPMPHISPC